MIYYSIGLGLILFSMLCVYKGIKMMLRARSMRLAAQVSITPLKYTNNAYCRTNGCMSTKTAYIPEIGNLCETHTWKLFEFLHKQFTNQNSVALDYARFDAGYRPAPIQNCTEKEIKHD